MFTYQCDEKGHEENRETGCFYRYNYAAELNFLVLDIFPPKRNTYNVNYLVDNSNPSERLKYNQNFFIGYKVQISNAIN